MRTFLHIPYSIELCGDLMEILPFRALVNYGFQAFSLPRIVQSHSLIGSRNLHEGNVKLSPSLTDISDAR